MNAKQLTKLIKKAGWVLIREGKGSHTVWEHQETGDIQVLSIVDSKPDGVKLKQIKKNFKLI